MNKTAGEAEDLVNEINSSLGNQTSVQVCVCPAFTALSKVSELLEQTEIFLGAQNMNAESSGAFTGEVSAEMLRELYVSFVILGHSERRQFYGECNSTINRKVLSAVENNLRPIYCIGETLDEREAGQTLNVVRTQVREGLKEFPSSAIENLVLAYEPVWAIGTGKTATDEMAQEVHHDIRKVLSEIFGDGAAETVRILYGGSMKPENALGLLSQPDVDGGLIGGASLASRSFCAIVDDALELSS